MKKLGKELEFISWIKRDGSGVVLIGKPWNDFDNSPKLDDTDYMDDYVFNINCLSSFNKTFIASGFNSFVVKIKQT
jgi:hypothetical protein